MMRRQSDPNGRITPAGAAHVRQAALTGEQVHREDVVALADAAIAAADRIEGE